MQRRELVKKTLAFDSPPRIARQLWLLPWAHFNYPNEVKKIQEEFPDDILPLGLLPLCKKQPACISGNSVEIGQYIDEWGCKYENRERGHMGEVKEPRVKTWNDLKTLRAPEELLTVDIAKVNQMCRDTDQFVLSPPCARPFERLQFIRGSENVYFDIMDNTAEFKQLIKIVHDFFLKQTELWAKTDVDGLYFSDDWGSQRALLVSPQTWREMFKPLYAEYFKIAHDHGKYVFMHSDGYIVQIIPELIEIGVNAINSQIFCMGAKNMAHLKGKITFWGEIDRQNLLPYGTPDDICKAVKDVYLNLYANGGVMAQCEFGPGAKPQNVRAVFDAWNKMM